MSSSVVWPAMSRRAMSSVAAPVISYRPVVTICRLKMLVPVKVPSMNVLAIVIVTELVDPGDGIPPDLVGNGIVSDVNPWTIIVWRGIPDIPLVQIVAVTEIKHVVSHSRRYIEPKFGGQKEYRRPVDNHRRSNVHRSRSANVYPYAYAYVGCVRNGNSAQQKGTADECNSHTKLLSLIQIDFVILNVLWNNRFTPLGQSFSGRDNRLMRP